MVKSQKKACPLDGGIKIEIVFGLSLLGPPSLQACAVLYGRLCEAFDYDGRSLWCGLDGYRSFHTNARVDAGFEKKK